MDGTAPAAARPWLLRLGTTAWLLVGVMLVLAGAVWLLDQTATITAPLIAGGVVGAVGGAVVGWLERRRVPRAAGAALVMLGLIALGLLVAVAVLGGITSQAPQIDAATAAAVDKVQGWAADAGITSASAAAKDVKQAVPDIGRTLLQGVADGISGLTSLLVFLGFTAFVSFFLLKDGPVFAGWCERHMGVPPAAARVVTGDLAHALRQYFVGLTIVGAFNATLVGLGALVLGVPLPVTIAAGSLFGVAGLVLAAPLVSGAVHIDRHLAELRGAGEAGGLAAPAAGDQPRLQPT